MAYGAIRLVEKTTIYLDAELRRRLRIAAKAHGVPQAELIRLALAEYLDEEPGPPLPSFVGAFAVGGDAGEDRRPVPGDVEPRARRGIHTMTVLATSAILAIVLR